jgi:agmatinase
MPAMSPNGNKGKIALLDFPWDENSSYLRGSAEAPALIRAALYCDASNLWTENGIDLGVELINIANDGDSAPADAVDMLRHIEESVHAVIDQGLRPIALGGDHSVTYPVTRAISKRHAGLTILDFDAHPDLYDQFQGSRYSHACPFARIMEEGLARRLVQVGVRTMNAQQRRQAERFGVEAIEMRDWRGVLPELESPVYVSFDIDALDPAFAPGVSHREPGGLSVREVVAAIQSISAEVIGADIVEFNPRLDALNTTAVVCAKLLKEIAAKMLE